MADAQSVKSFCKDNGICTATFYNLCRVGRGPATMKVGARRLISAQAASEWRKRMEAEAAVAVLDRLLASEIV